MADDAAHLVCALQILRDSGPGVTAASEVYQGAGGDPLAGHPLGDVPPQVRRVGDAAQLGERGAQRQVVGH